jgi:hypothetical protein
VRENEGVAARILLDFDADSEKIRNEVIRMLSGPGGRQRGGPDEGVRQPLSATLKQRREMLRKANEIRSGASPDQAGAEKRGNEGP